MVNWLLTGIAGGGAFILSLLIGLLSDVTAGAIFLRAFIWGLVFAVFANIARMVMMNFLPDLFGFDDVDAEVEMSSDDFETKESSGGKVNIVLGEDDEIPLEAADELDEAETGGFVAQGLGSVNGESPIADNRGDEVEEVQEFDAADEEDIQEVSDAEPVESVASAAAAASSGGAIPDIGQFEGDFSGGSDEVAATSEAGTRTAEVLGGLHDTEEMAQAVHTILQKDQEG